jgi:parvulin-like peptidyl-prolyl isomerase
VRAGRRAAAVVLLLAWAEACRRSAGTLAVVGGQSVTLDAVAAAITVQSGKPLAEVDPELATALFEAYLEEEVVLAASGVPADRVLRDAARSARARDLLATHCPPPPPPPSEAEVRAYVVAHHEMVPRGERLLLRQLILPDQPSARAAQERARRGDDFAALSRELSRAPNAATGGALGWVERGQLPPEFEAAVFPLAAKAISAPVASSAGWHVFQVVERRTDGTPDSNTVALARAMLAAEAAERARRSCLRVLANRVGVEVLPGDKAPFPIHDPFEEKP